MSLGDTDRAACRELRFYFRLPLLHRRKPSIRYGQPLPFGGRLLFVARSETRPSGSRLTPMFSYDRAIRV